jgi:methyl-accepting chemotaxis protein
VTNFKEFITTDEVRAAFKEFGDNRDLFLKNLNEMRRLAKEGKDDEAFALLDGEGKRTSDLQQALLLKLMDLTVANAKETDDTSDLKSHATKNSFWALIVVGIVIAMGMGILLTRSIVTPLKAGLVMMNSLAAGHLQRRLRLSRRDEIGQLGNVMDRFADDLQDNVVKSMAKVSRRRLQCSTDPQRRPGRNFPRSQQNCRIVCGVW